MYSVGLIQPAEFRAILKVRQREFRRAVRAGIGVLVLGTPQGIVVAVALSLAGLAVQTAHPAVAVIGRKLGTDVQRPLSRGHADDQTFSGLSIIRPVGRLYFANALNVGDTIRALIAKHEPRVVALDLSRVPDIAHSALTMLQEGVRQTNVTVWLADPNPGVLDVVRGAGLDEELGPDRLLLDVHLAIQRYEAMQEKPGFDQGRPCRTRRAREAPLPGARRSSIPPASTFGSRPRPAAHRTGSSPGGALGSGTLATAAGCRGVDEVPPPSAGPSSRPRSPARG